MFLDNANICNNGLYKLHMDVKMELTVMKKNEIFTTSLAISEGVGLEHRAVIILLKKHSNTETLKAFEMTKAPTLGRPIDVAYLTEVQATFLITLMRNSPRVIEFKERLTKAFFNQRCILQQMFSQKHNEEWLIKRQETKIMRRELNDTIQEFVNYARSQGSKSADKYYMNFSRMELTGLFIIEQRYPNARDVMSVRQLNLIEMADEAIAISLKESMQKELHYKECYKAAKDKISLLVKIFPRSPLPQLLSREDDQTP